MFLFLALVFKRKPLPVSALQLGDVTVLVLFGGTPPQLCRDNAPKRLLGKETFSYVEKS